MGAVHVEACGQAEVACLALGASESEEFHKAWDCPRPVDGYAVLLVLCQISKSGGCHGGAYCLGCQALRSGLQHRQSAFMDARDWAAQGSSLAKQRTMLGGVMRSRLRDGGRRDRELRHGLRSEDGIGRQGASGFGRATRISWGGMGTGGMVGSNKGERQGYDAEV